MKLKACRVCKEEFSPFNSLQFCCGVQCALDYSRKKREANDRRAEKAAKAKERKARRKAKANSKTLSDWLSDAQVHCNAYIRERDRDLPCISCGTQNPDIQYCAGHYRTRGAAPELRFNPLNIHLQCNKNCNLEKSGNIVEYRIRLKERIGESALTWLEGPHQAQHYTIEDAKEIKAHYKQLLREIS